MTAGGFRLTCRRCGVALIAVGPRLTGDALRMLARHVRRLHPDARLSPDAGAGDVLSRFDVERVS